MDNAVDSQAAETQSEKVHVRGVDDLTTDNIKQFARDHFAIEEPNRVEWIDDTSANIVYSTPEIGLQALSALTQIGEEEDMSALPALRLRSANLLSSHPDSVLQVRTAVKTDRKKPRAHEVSRFYLMHPEHDPRERLRLELAERRREGDDTSNGDYKRRRFDGRELRRRRDRADDQLISADMYDDNAEASDRKRRGRRELFPSDEGGTGRLRNRSASPGRDTLESDRLESERNDRRFRERSPKRNRRNDGKELFSSSSARAESDSSSRELFPNKPTTSYLKKELFPSKVSNHRRSDAIDAADETLSSRISAPSVTGSHDQSNRNQDIELFPASSGRGLNIRGTAQGEGLSVRGAANGISIKGKGVRELLPSTYGSNAGKELFSNRLEGRGGPRRRAEDMFS